jgi:hypothetical protein
MTRILDEAWSAVVQPGQWGEQQRIALLHVLGLQLKRLPASEVRVRWSQLLRGRSQTGYREFLIDLRELGPVLTRRLGWTAA